MSTKNDWYDDKVDVNKLSLDLQNPRVPKHIKEHNDIVQIRNYLLNKEGVLRIARSIANNGYHKSAVAIVYKEDGKLIVLDGNRRLVACQLLLDPKLAPNTRDKKELEILNHILDKKQLESVKITIAPSRKDAEKEIWDIHVNQLLKPWEVLQKLRMYRNLIDSGDYNIDTASSEYGIKPSDFKNELAKLYFYEQILERTDDKGEEELLRSGFNKIDRLILSKNGKKLLDYTVNDKGDVIVSNQTEFDKKLKELIPYIVVRDKIGAQVKQEELEETVFSVIDPVKFPKKKLLAKEKEVSQKKFKKITGGTLVKPDWITYGDYTKYKGAERVKRMLEEMYKLDTDKNKNVLLVSLRVLLELSLYHKLEGRGYIKKMEKIYKDDLKAKNKKRVSEGKSIIPTKTNWSPGFQGMLNYIIEESNGVVNDPQTRDALKAVVKGEKNFVEDLNKFIHNSRYIPAKGDPEKIWSQFGRLLFNVISKIM